MKLSKKVAVITGGSGGIGRAIAILMAQKGAYVVLCARNEIGLRETAELIKKTGGVCTYFVADVTNAAQVHNLVEETIRLYKSVDILINNAGIGIFKSLFDTAEKDWENIINTNLRGPFLCAKEFAFIMKEQKKGYIINIVSGAAKKGYNNLSVYCASKHGLLGLSRAIRLELKPLGIEVIDIFPGYTKTSFFKDFGEHFRLPKNASDPNKIAKHIIMRLNFRSILRLF
jgi:NAD(P)-dependent dehydrogenase (short-subunit alcohol dehydrogenase family)